MSGGRPRTAIGTYGAVYVTRRADRCVAETRFRDLDGRLRKVTATDRSPSAAKALLKERLLRRAGYGSGGQLSLASPFGHLVELWLADLELRELADGTKDSYRDQVRLHVLPAFEHFTLGEVTTGRVEWFLKSQAAVSHSRAQRSRTMLNLLFGFALRHDAMPRNPVEGTSSLRNPKSQPQALSLAQIASIRAAAATWRTEPGQPGPKPDGQVRDIIEVLLGTAMRPGEVLALRPCDVEDSPTGMVVAVTGTVVQHRGRGAVRQGRPKSDASIRQIPVPEFAAVVLRRRLVGIPSERTIFANRSGGPLSPYNVRRTFREFLADAGLADSGISLRWYRSTGATVIARSLGSDAAAAFLGHTSSTITEGHYIERDRTIDPTPAAQLERTLRPEDPDGTLLSMPPAIGEAQILATVGDDPDVGDVA
jgi:integrase